MNRPLSQYMTRLNTGSQTTNLKKMKTIFRHILIAAALIAGSATADAQMIKVNAPAILVGTPNIGYEHGLTPHISVSGDIMWLPYLSKKHEEVFRSLQVAGECRYYFKESEHVCNKIAKGWYAGIYAMYGNFNIGIYRNNDMDQSFRRQGWGCSAGVSGGWKYEFNRHWQMDINLGVGYAHLQYDKYKLGGLYKNYPMKRKQTRGWVGPTRFSISIGYIIDNGCKKEKDIENETRQL